LEDHGPYHKDKTKIQRCTNLESPLPSTSVSKKLSHELSNLDIDEGVRIESTKNGKNMYINKRTSGFFVLEICSDLNNTSEIRFYRDIKHIHKLINDIFGREYSVTIY
jgi:hypothetical protein